MYLLRIENLDTRAVGYRLLSEERLFNELAGLDFETIWKTEGRFRLTERHTYRPLETFTDLSSTRWDEMRTEDSCMYSRHIIGKVANLDRIEELAKKVLDLLVSEPEGDTDPNEEIVCYVRPRTISNRVVVDTTPDMLLRTLRETGHSTLDWKPPVINEVLCSPNGYRAWVKPILATDLEEIGIGLAEFKAFLSLFSKYPVGLVFPPYWREEGEYFWNTAG